MPVFTSDYPNYQTNRVSILPTPERVGAYSEFRGRGVTIAFVDAGFYAHADLGDRILLHVDASTNHIIEQTEAIPTADLSWHGLMTSVIACGNGKMSGGRFRGIASEAHLVLVRVSTPNGTIKEVDILRGLRWLADAHRRYNIQIINISVGGDHVSYDPNHPLHKIITKLTAANVTVIVAAGNRNEEYLFPPASAADAITVGGVDDHNSVDRKQWTHFHHNFGRSHDGTPKPDVLASANWIASPILPGSQVARESYWLSRLLQTDESHMIKTILQQGHNDLGLTREQLEDTGHVFQMLQNRIRAHKIVDANHQFVQGTSVAAPIVSSVVAQLLEANPSLTPHQIRAILTATARPLNGQTNKVHNCGVLDPAAAVELAINRQRQQG